MTAAAGFPIALRSSAVPRWSHRDPVEGRNPFSGDDPRRPAWESATATAREALLSVDADVEREARTTTDPAIYREWVIGLAEARFDVWARRGLCVVHDADARSAYASWLATYVDNWLRYVRETCPQVEADPDLRTRLTGRARHWAAEARRLAR